VTRSRAGNAAWSAKLRKAGFAVLGFEALRFRVLSENAAELRRGVKDADWLVFSSARGVRAAAELAIVPRPGQRIACVGIETARACHSYLREAELFSPEQTATGLAQLLLREKAWQSAALIGAQEGRPELPQALREAGKQVIESPVYATSLPTPEETSLDWRAGDRILVASPSSVHALMQAPCVPDGLLWISIGPTTSAALREAGLPVSAEAEERNIDGMLAALQSLEPKT